MDLELPYLMRGPTLAKASVGGRRRWRWRASRGGFGAFYRLFYRFLSCGLDRAAFSSGQSSSL